MSRKGDAQRLLSRIKSSKVNEEKAIQTLEGKVKAFSCRGIHETLELLESLWLVHHKQIEHHRRSHRKYLQVQQLDKAQVALDSLHSLLKHLSAFYRDILQGLRTVFRRSTVICADVYLILAADRQRKRTAVEMQFSLICLGDVERCRVLHSGTATRDFSTARSLYTAAEHLFPGSGKCHNQLALIFVYEKDFLNAYFHYEAALVSSSPFPTSRDNLTLLFASFRSKGGPRNLASVLKRRKTMDRDDFVALWLALHAEIHLRCGLVQVRGPAIDSGWTVGAMKQFHRGLGMLSESLPRVLPVGGRFDFSADFLQLIQEESLYRMAQSCVLAAQLFAQDGSDDSVSNSVGNCMVQALMFRLAALCCSQFVRCRQESMVLGEPNSVSGGRYMAIVIAALHWIRISPSLLEFGVQVEACDGVVPIEILRKVEGIAQHSRLCFLAAVSAVSEHVAHVKRTRLSEGADAPKGLLPEEKLLCGVPQYSELLCTFLSADMMVSVACEMNFSPLQIDNRRLERFCSDVAWIVAGHSHILVPCSPDTPDKVCFGPVSLREFERLHKSRTPPPVAIPKKEAESSGDVEGIEGRILEEEEEEEEGKPTLPEEPAAKLDHTSKLFTVFGGGDKGLFGGLVPSSADPFSLSFDLPPDPQPPASEPDGVVMFGDDTLDDEIIFDVPQQHSSFQFPSIHRQATAPPGFAPVAAPLLFQPSSGRQAPPGFDAIDEA